MKKTVIAILAFAMSISLFGCSGGDTAPTVTETETVVETQTEQTTAAVSESETEATTAAPVLDSSAVTVSMIDGKVIFEISPAAGLSDSAWLGMVTPGTSYDTETEARADRKYWVWAEGFDKRKASDPYVFIYSGEDIAMLPQEDFTMVLCDSENNGRVVLQFPVTVSGVEIKCDLEQIKIN